MCIRDSFYSFHIMILIGCALGALFLVGLWGWKKGWLFQKRWLQMCIRDSPALRPPPFRKALPPRLSMKELSSLVQRSFHVVPREEDFHTCLLYTSRCV